MGAVHRYEGTVSQVMRDGIMALFGMSLAHEDHAVRACPSIDGRSYDPSVALLPTGQGPPDSQLTSGGLPADPRPNYTGHLSAVQSPES